MVMDVGDTSYLVPCGKTGEAQEGLGEVEAATIVYRDGRTVSAFVVRGTVTLDKVEFYAQRHRLTGFVLQADKLTAYRAETPGSRSSRYLPALQFSLPDALYAVEAALVVHGEPATEADEVVDIRYTPPIKEQPPTTTAPELQAQVSAAVEAAGVTTTPSVSDPAED